MPLSELPDLISIAEQLSPERSPAQAVELNQQILALDSTNAAAQMRLARAYQAQRKFAEAKAACQEALRLNPGSTVAKQRLQRISEEWELAKEAQAVSDWNDAFQRGVLFSMISNSRGTHHRISALPLVPLGFGSHLIDRSLKAPEPQLVRQVVWRNE